MLEPHGEECILAGLGVLSAVLLVLVCALNQARCPSFSGGAFLMYVFFAESRGLSSLFRANRVLARLTLFPNKVRIKNGSTLPVPISHGLIPDPIP